MITLVSFFVFVPILSDDWNKDQVKRSIVTCYNLKGLPKSTIEYFFGQPDGRNIDASGSIFFIQDNWRERAVYVTSNIVITYDGQGRCMGASVVNLRNSKRRTVTHEP
jgi:hypothetical protein